VGSALEEAIRGANLSEWQRVLLYLHYWLDWSLSEIAEEFSLSERAVRREHRQALEALTETRLLGAGL